MSAERALPRMQTTAPVYLALVSEADEVAFGKLCAVGWFRGLLPEDNDASADSDYLPIENASYKKFIRPRVM